MKRILANQLYKMLLVVVVCAVVITAIGWGISNSNKDIVASVDGEKITKEELYNLLVEQGGEQALESLITERLIKLESKKQNVQVSDVDIQTEIEKYYDSYGGKESFEQAVTASGTSLVDMREDVAITLQLKRLLEPRITINDEELKTYFQENKDSFAVEKQVKASHILVDSEDIAQEVKNKLAGGTDFAQLAKEYSSDTGTKEKGGDLGFFGSGDMVKEFEDVAFALVPGVISDPVKTEYGYHLIKVVEQKAAQEATYEGNVTKIKDLILEEKLQTEYSVWLQELYEKYDIENFLAKA